MSNMLPAWPLFSSKIVVMVSPEIAWRPKAALVLGSELSTVFKPGEELGLIIGNGVT
jgi:hypothetical protein